MKSFLLMLFLASARGFSWDEFNVDRLFGNSDEVFGTLRVEPEEKECVGQFRSFVDALKRNEKWALRVMDSWAKEPAGLSSHVDTDYGHFDQCVDSNERFPTQLCLLNAENAQNSSYKLGLCLPRTCSKNTVLKITAPFFLNLRVSAGSVLVCSSTEKPPFGAFQWIVISIFSALILAAIIATVYELRGGQGLLRGLSLYHNTNKLFEAKPSFGPMNCLNGLRVLSMAWVVLHHAYHTYYYIYDLYNPDYMKHFQLTFTRAWVHHADLAVDTFFVIGGLLLSFNFLKGRQKGQPFNLIKFYLHRYLRLMPVFVTVLLLLMAFNEYPDTGPQEWQLTDNIAVPNCKKYWWSAVLLVQNYVNPEELCIAPSWYISADFQLYVLSPLILFPLAKYGKKFLPVLAVVGVASLGFLFGFTFANGFHFNFTDPPFKNQTYYPAHARVAQWLIGITLGFILFKTQNREARISRPLNLALWALAGAVMSLCIVLPYTQYHGQTESVLGFAFFTALHRQLWALSMAWVIFACIKGYGGPVTWILSFPFYQPIAKLSYAVYIFHVPLAFQIGGLQRTLVYFNEYLMFHFYLGLFTLALLLVIPIVLMVEMPIPSLEAAMYGIFRRKDEKNASKADEA